MPGNCADVRRDGHAVVVENHDQRLPARARVVKSLVGKPACKRAVSDEGDNTVVLLFQRPCPRHAERDRNGVGCMPGDKSVCDALRRVRKAGHTAELTQPVKAFCASGEQLVNIALMTDIKDKPVLFRVEHALDGKRPADMANQKLADFPAKLPLFGVCQRQKIRSGMNFL